MNLVICSRNDSKFVRQGLPLVKPYCESNNNANSFKWLAILSLKIDSSILQTCDVKYMLDSRG